ncbi:MAG: hypothetical protein D6741_04960 [Planctomycetota bacterium]|nr:MAG: hypothetical protein D6741_04960 [Planctomycetota bacterium]
MRVWVLVAPLVVLAATSAAAQQQATVEGTAAEQTEPQPSALAELDGLVGRWVDKGDDAVITTDCEWTLNKRFLKRTFRVETDGQTVLEGTQFVGWDPVAGHIRSWTFDSEGGVGQGVWIRDANRWLVKKSFVLADGRRASAINVITVVDENTIRWQSTNREIDGELQPNVPEVTVVRQADEASQANEEASQ